MKTIKKKLTAKHPEITEHFWNMVHAAFVAQSSQLDLNYGDPPTIQQVARLFGAPLREAERRHCVEYWEAERDSNHWKAWWEIAGEGAKTEAEFIEARLARRSDLVGEGPHGVRWVTALAREIWLRHAAAVTYWDAVREEAAASKALDEARAARAAA